MRVALALAARAHARGVIALAVLASGCASPIVRAEPTSAEPTSGDEAREREDRAGALVITAIDVGQGDCALVECPNGAQMVIDCGSSGGGDRERVAAFLDARLDGELEVLVVTHPDADHINYLAPSESASSVIGNRPIGRALLSLNEATYRQTDVGDQLMNWLEESASEIRFLRRSDASPEDEQSDLFDCGDTAVYILAASERSQSSARALQRNTPSIVLLLERELANGEHFRAMLTGDATRETEAAVLARYSGAFLDVDLLKVGHHGALTSTVDPDDPAWPWLSVTSPRYAFTTAGHHMGHKHPRCAISRAIIEGDSLEPAACHEIECAEAEDCDGAIDGPWCTSASARAIFNSANNGDVAFTVDAQGARVSISRGARPARDCGE